jgi:two-component system, chemotaxis family, sensor kinase CheA
MVRVSNRDIKRVMDREVAVIGDSDIPLMRLQKIFSSRERKGLFLTDEELKQAKHQLQAELVIITKQEHAQPIGLVVDEVFAQQDIVVKPLSGILKSTKGFAGVTLLGDGKPALILDVNSLSNNFIGH